MKNLNIFCVAISILLISTMVSAGCHLNCRDVSDQNRAVDCINNVCVCLYENGFIGNATLNDPCRCPEPRIIKRIDGTHYCVDIPEAVQNQLDNERCDRFKSKVSKIYQNVIYPSPLQIMLGNKSVSDLFHPDVKARITPFGNFIGYTSVLEYFYGISSSPLDQTRSVDIWKLKCEGNQVTSEVNVYNQFIPGAPMPPFYNTTHLGVFTFDLSSELVKSIEVSVLNLGAVLDPPPVPALKTAYIQSTCNTLTGPSVYSSKLNGTCPDQWNGQTQQERFLDCVAFMQSIPFGTWYRVPSNAYICRQFYSLLTIYRPEVYCANVGKTGGFSCVDTPYSAFYSQQF